MNAHDAQPIVIVEDSDDDFEATERALKQSGPLTNPILRFANGSDALDYLLPKTPGGGKAGARPAFVLLDLNLPGVDGREVLKALKGDESTRDIPVVVLTTSDADWDINQCYQIGANTYVRKPVDLVNLFTAIRNLKEYWLEVAILPRRA